LMFGSQAQYRVSIFRVVESDALDGAGQCIHNNKYTRPNTI
jgi:hypothetical protein